jgi:phage baseplate assembly protein W
MNQTLKSNYVFDLDSIKQSILTILTTSKNTRLFLAEFGSNLEDIIHEPMTEELAFQMYNEIVDAIWKWEPRVTLDTGLSEVIPDYSNHIYRIKLVFEVNGLGDSKFEQVIGLSK